MSYKAEKTILVKTDLCEKEIKEALDFFEGNIWLKKHDFEKPFILYHYTSAEGMQKILESRSFWSSDITLLNDSLEIKYGKKIILDKLNSYLVNEKDEGIKFFIKKMSEVIGIHNTYNTYITCFSENDNILSQWERYANNGKGYNLGIRFSSEKDSKTKLSHSLKKITEIKYPVLRKVIYEVEEQYDITDKFINTVLEGARKTVKRKNEVYEFWGAPASLYATNILLEMMLSFKSPSYREENEWRLIYMISKEYKPELRDFRINNNIVVSYLNTYLYEEVNGNFEFPLQSIKSGPMLIEDAVKESLKDFLYNLKTCSEHLIKINNKIKTN